MPESEWASPKRREGIRGAVRGKRKELMEKAVLYHRRAQEEDSRKEEHLCFSCFCCQKSQH